MALATHTRLGHFEIVEHVAAGGMGEVYRARDLRLARTVAIKVLPHEFAQHTDRRERTSGDHLQAILHWQSLLKR